MVSDRFEKIDELAVGIVVDFYSTGRFCEENTGGTSEDFNVDLVGRENLDEPRGQVGFASPVGERGHPPLQSCFSSKLDTNWPVGSDSSAPIHWRVVGLDVDPLTFSRSACYCPASILSIGIFRAVQKIQPRVVRIPATFPSRRSSNSRAFVDSQLERPAVRLTLSTLNGKSELRTASTIRFL